MESGENVFNAQRRRSNLSTSHYSFRCFLKTIKSAYGFNDSSCFTQFKVKRQSNNLIADLFSYAQTPSASAVPHPCRGRMQRDVVEDCQDALFPEIFQKPRPDSQVLHQKVIHVGVMMAVGGYHRTTNLPGGLESRETLMVFLPDFQSPPGYCLCLLHLGGEECRD